MGKRTLGDCVRCFTPTPAVTTETLTFGGDRYKWELCDSHADAFRRDIYSWTRCGELDEELVPRFTKPAEERRRGKVIKVHVAIPAARVASTPAPAPKPEPVLANEPVAAAQPRLKLMDLPAGYDKWKFSDHAVERLTLRMIRPEQALWAACRPDIVHPGSEPGTLIHTRGNIRVVVNPAQRIIITAIDKSVNTEQELERYQNAASA